jgi:hypothetical protein
MCRRLSGTGALALRTKGMLMIRYRGSAAFLCAVLIPGLASADLPIRTIALSGQPAPGTADGVAFSGFGAGLINEDGDVAIYAGLTGPGVIQTHPSNAYTLYRHQDGILSQIIRSGDQALGHPAGIIYQLPNLVGMDDEGHVAIHVATAPPVLITGRRASIYSEGQGSLRLVAAVDQQAAGRPAGENYYLLEDQAMNASGQLTFNAYAGGTDTEGLWTDRSGSVEPVIVSGDAAPGIPGATMRGASKSLALNDNGVIAFVGQFEPGGIPIDEAIWTEQTGVFTLLARDDQQPGGLPAGVVFGRFDALRLNNAGHVLTRSTLVGPGIDLTNDAALWLHDQGAMHLLAREGQSLGAVIPDVSLGEIPFYYLNEPGNITLVSSLTGPSVTADNDTAMWSLASGHLTLLAREGDPAPGAAGALFGDLIDAHDLQFNNFGQVAFQSRLTGPSITSANDRGMWVTDFAGNLRLLTREGDLFDVNDDPLAEDLRTVRTIDRRWAPGRGSFNSSGELVIALDFQDFTSGAFVVSTVPEPSSLALLAATALAACATRRPQ